MRINIKILIGQVDFFWVNREQKMFEWFTGILSQLEVEMSEIDNMSNFLSLHLFLTSALQKTDMQTVLLQLAMDLVHRFAFVIMLVEFFFSLTNSPTTKQ